MLIAVASITVQFRVTVPPDRTLVGSALKLTILAAVGGGGLSPQLQAWKTSGARSNASLEERWSMARTSKRADQICHSDPYPRAMKKEVRIYTRHDCQYCDYAKELLNERGI